MKTLLAILVAVIICRIVYRESKYLGLHWCRIGWHSYVGMKLVAERHTPAGVEEFADFCESNSCVFCDEPRHISDGGEG